MTLLTLFAGVLIMYGFEDEGSLESFVVCVVLVVSHGFILFLFCVAIYLSITSEGVQKSCATALGCCNQWENGNIDEMSRQFFAKMSEIQP